MKTQKGSILIIVLVIALLLGSLAGYFYWQTHKASVYPRVNSHQAPSDKSRGNADTPSAAVMQKAGTVTGKVLIYEVGTEEMTIQLIAQSTKGNVTGMRVWTNNMQDSGWKPFSTLVKLPISKSVYAQFKDDQGNTSEIYSDTLFPPYGPPLR